MAPHKRENEVENRKCEIRKVRKKKDWRSRATQNRLFTSKPDGKMDFEEDLNVEYPENNSPGKEEEFLFGDEAPEDLDPELLGNESDGGPNNEDENEEDGDGEGEDEDEEDEAEGASEDGSDEKYVVQSSSSKSS